MTDEEWAGRAWTERRVATLPPPSTTPYLILAISMAALAIISVTVISITRPDRDNSILITAILGFIGTATMSGMTFMKAQETHRSVDGRLEEFLASTRLAAHAQGLDEGRRQGLRSANERTDLLAAAAPAAPPVIEALDRIERAVRAADLLFQEPPK